MAEGRPASINLLPSGVPGLDSVLGGGLVEFSFNLIAGAPGAGKTTAAQQMLFTNSTLDRPGIYFTVLGEPQLKMLRYQQQFSFFDRDKFGRSVRFQNLSDQVLHEGLDAVLSVITDEVEQSRPGFVVVDSFHSVITHVPHHERWHARVPAYHAGRWTSGRSAAGAGAAGGCRSGVAISRHGNDDGGSERRLHAVPVQPARCVLHDRRSRRSTVHRAGRQYPQSHDRREDARQRAPTDWRAYTIDAGGIHVGEVLHDYRGIITGVPVPREDPAPVFHSRLSAAEVAVLNAVSERGETGVEPIMQRTDLDAANVRGALDRLVLLGYLVAVDENEQTLYRAPGGQRE